MITPEIPNSINAGIDPNAYPIVALGTAEGLTRVLEDANFTQRVLPALGITATHSNYDNAATQKRLELLANPDELEAYAILTVDRAYEENDTFERMRRDRKTGLLDTDGWFNQLNVAIEWARATGGRVAIVLFDLDGFKVANKVLGQLGGDQVIKDVANVLLNEVRDGKRLCGRLGGDEFGAILKLPPRGERDLVSQKRRIVGPSLSEGDEMQIAVGRMNEEVDNVVAKMNEMFATKGVPRLGVSRGAVLLQPGMTGDGAAIEADRLVSVQKDRNLDALLVALGESDRERAIRYMKELVQMGLVDRRNLPLKKSEVAEE